MESLPQSSLERIASESRAKSPIAVAAVVVATYTLMAGAIFWGFSGRYSTPAAPYVAPTGSREFVQCQRESLTKLADLSQCNKQSKRTTE